MRKMHLQDVDLNLLHALRALLEERHVTRAAKRCFLSQPAMSRSLERLREMFGDLLLIRSGRAYERTVRGERVLRELESIMPRGKHGPRRRIQSCPKPGTFSSCHDRPRGNGAHAPLMEHLRTAATNVKVTASPWNDRVYEEIAIGRIDIALSAEAPPPQLEAEVLYDMRKTSSA